MWPPAANSAAPASSASLCFHAKLPAKLAFVPYPLGFKLNLEVGAAPGSLYPKFVVSLSSEHIKSRVAFKGWALQTIASDMRQNLRISSCFFKMKWCCYYRHIICIYLHWRDTFGRGEPVATSTFFVPIRSSDDQMIRSSDDQMIRSSDHRIIIASYHHSTISSSYHGSIKTSSHHLIVIVIFIIMMVDCAGLCFIIIVIIPFFQLLLVFLCFFVFTTISVSLTLF